VVHYQPIVDLHGGRIRVAIAGDHYVEDESSAKKCYTIKIFDLRTDKVLRTIEAHEDTITALELLSEGTLLASASEDKTIKIWDLITGERVQTYFGQYSVTGLALTGHNRLVSIDQGGLVHLHKIEPKTIDLDLIHKYFSQGKGKISIMSNLNVIQVNFDPVLIWEEAVLAEFLKQFIDTVFYFGIKRRMFKRFFKICKTEFLIIR
jgi:WD40 repeat protein